MLTSLYIALLAFIYIFLTVNVIKVRFRTKVVIGDGANTDLNYAIRAQANFSELIPLALLLLLAVDLQAGSLIFIHIIGIMLVLGRLSHAASMLYFERQKDTMKFRIFGTMLTMLSLLASAIYNIVLYFMTA